jgi:hypothetical protein
MSTVEGQRKSPEVRLTPMAMLVFEDPLPLPAPYAERFATSRPKLAPGGGHLDERKTPGVQAMVERVPADACGYLAAICYSSGQATALASHISRDGYGRGVQVAHGPIPNANKRGMNREHAVLLRKS